MRTDVNQRIGLILKPEVKGNIGVTRHARQVMIAVLAPLLQSAFRLQRNPDFAKACSRKMKGTVAGIRVVLGVPHAS